MFLKEREIPILVQKCEALLRNFPPNHPLIPEIKSIISIKMAGHYGEKTHDYHLTSLNEEKYDIYPGLRLANNNRFFQIDSFLLSNNYLLVIEVKNLKGELEFDSSKGQLIQTIGDQVNVFDDPFAQVQQQKFQIIKWLEYHKIGPIPVDILVVLTNSHSHIKKLSGSSNHYWKLCRCISATEKIKNFEHIYQKEFITTKIRKKLGKLLLKSDTPLDHDTNLLNKFNIPPEQIVTGVLCPHCLTNPMNFKYGLWVCPTCNFQSKTAHEQKVFDYFLINNEPITNKQFRKITQIESRHQATRLLNSMGLPLLGANRGSIYLPPNK